MTNLQKVLHTLQGNEEVRKNLERAKDKYEEKPFALEHANTYAVVTKVSWLPSAVSVAGASLAFITLMPNMPIYVPLLIGGILATGYEALKAWATSIGYRVYFKHGSIAALVVVALLYLGSVSISTFGAYNGYQLLENDKVGTALADHTNAVDSLNAYYAGLRESKKQAFTNEVDSLGTYYEGLISEQTSAIADYESKHTDKASGDIRWGAHKQHGNLVQGLADLRSERKDVLRNLHETSKAELATLESEYKEAIQALKAKQPSVIRSAKDSMGAYLWLALGVALLIEVVIFAFRWFAEYYDYKSNKQVELLEKGDVLQVDTRSLEKLAMLLQSSSSPYQLQMNGAETSSKGIGFKSGQQATAQQPNTQAQTDDKGKKCLNCNSAYTPSVSWQKYCSDTCRESYNNNKK